MSWGEPHTNGAGSTGQIAEAHRALDAVGIQSGPLALRVLAAAGRIDGLREDLEELQLVADRWRDVAEMGGATKALVAETTQSPVPTRRERSWGS